MPPLNDLTHIAGYLNISFTIIVVLAVLAFCILNIDKLILLKGIIAGLFAGLFSSARKTQIASQIRGRTMKAVKKINSKENPFLPHDLKIEWVRDENKDTFLKNNQIIIRMRQSSNPHENFVNAMMSFVSSGLLLKERSYIDPKIMKAADISVVKKLILEASEDSLNFFNNHIMESLLEEDNDIKEYIHEIATLDGNGMFLNILLNEFSKAGQQIYPEILDPGLVAESKEFLGYLYRIAADIRASTNDGLTFNRDYFKVAIILTAKTETYEKKGLRPYINAVAASINSGVKTIYIFGLGKKIDIAKEVAKTVSDNDFRIIDSRTHYYKHRSLREPGGKVSGVCIEIIVSNT